MSADVLVYDGKCGFCTWWADYFARRTALETVPYAELTDNVRERLPEDYEDCSHLGRDGLGRILSKDEVRGTDE
ncbi:hypothetical protein BRC75_02555 [Halobacteriales archaeon QH_7_69_31]|nr:MAG: hypothetical protein BRC75_02555 [Halobacteriales archaeon QH_7_69_31]